MIRNPYHPVGLIIRRGPNGQNRFAVADSVGGREVSHGYDWQAAYDHWLQTRRARVPVPHPLPLSWLLKEFVLSAGEWAMNVCAKHTQEKRD
jgi:hypothetical protein